MEGLFFTGERPIPVGRAEGFWRRPWLDQERRRLSEETSGTALPAVSDEVKRLARRTDERSQISAFLQCVEALRADGTARALSHEERRALVETAAKILSRAGIGTSGSNLSSLHDELLAAVGARLDTVWLGALAESKALSTVTWLTSHSASDPSIERARKLRTVAEYFQAEDELESLEKRPGTFLPSLDLFWEKHLHAISRDGDLTRLPKSERPPREVYLWAYALPERSDMARFPKVNEGIVGTLEQAYDPSRPKAIRWAELVATFETDAETLDTQELVLFTAAVVRWLLRHRERQSAEALNSVYGNAAWILSRGLTRDHLSLFEAEPRPQTLPAIPQQWQRAGALSSLTLEVALLLGRIRFASLFGNEWKKKRLREEEAKALTEILIRHLSGPKGPIMKLGQTASYFGWQLAGLASNALAALQADSSPLETAAIVRVVEEELGCPLADVFASFEETPCGVGSIGQVHRARLRNGDAVAVKVQYPGIEAAIRLDVRLLHLCLPLFRTLTAAAVNRDLLHELQAQLLGECDYEREARITERFRRLFADVPGLVIPRVHASLRPRVLVTEYIQGQTFGEFRDSSTLDEKQQACEALTEYVVRGCCVGIFNSDPHPGNFLFRRREDKVEVACLDFGAVKEWPLDVTVPWAELVLAGTLRDYPLFQKAIEGMGIVTDANNFDFKRLFDVYTGGAMGSAILDEPQRMTHEQLHAELKGYADRRLLSHTYFRPDYLYSIRVYTGLISLLASFDAPINYFHHIKTICLKSLGQLKK